LRAKLSSVVVAIALSLAIVGGCMSNAVAPGTGVNENKLAWLNQFLNDGGAQRGSGINFNNCPKLFDTTLSQVVSPYGCQMDMIHGAEKIGFSFPWNAVKTSTRITIRVTKYQASFGPFWLLDCGPDGTVFGNPLYVQPNSAVTSSSKSVLFYYNPTIKQWEVQEVERGANPQIPIYHFSKYGISG
jgi:hypothetical protein